MATSDLAVSVRNLSKRYIIQRTAARHTSLGEALMHRLRNPFERTKHESFAALNNVSFDIHQGDVVGIIGRNGAGKSTLLKILSRITEPSAGEIDVYGRVGSLLEVGTGFHSELTGRENIYLNGCLLGMRRSEIDRQFDAIVDFAGGEQFLDTPVKRYSSGMLVRLAFAVASHLSSEILVVDEVLAVGDAEFQKKCLGKMQDVAHSGRTVFLVSHTMASVTNLCTKCVVLQRGELGYYGETEPAVEFYLASMEQAANEAKRDITFFRPPWACPLITSARLLDANGEQQTRFPLGSDVTVELTFAMRGEDRLRAPMMGVTVNHATFGMVGEVNSVMTDFRADGGPFASATMRCTLHNLPYLQGEYSLDLWLGEGLEYSDTVSGYLTFEIEASDVYGTGRVPFAHKGVTFLRPTWQLFVG